MADPEDPLFLARYPFLPRARDRVHSGGYLLGDLLTDAAYERSRRRAAERVRGALDAGGIVEAAVAGALEAERELLSYPVARALVASVDDAYLTQRYAVAESKLFGRRLADEDDETVLAVAAAVGLPLQPADAAFARLPFLDYLRNAPTRDPSWKLVNQALHAGHVSLGRDRVVRLAEAALKDRLLEELDGLERPGRAFAKAFERDLNQIRTLVASHRERFAPEATGPIRVEAFPPCMQAIWKGIQGHVNVPHMGRFAIVSFLHTLGMSSEEILRFFGSVPDFDVNKSRYQIEHITGQIGATQYTPPSCSTMQTYGICPLEQRDDLCLHVIHHPLSYYRKRARALPPPARPPEVKDAAAGGPAQPG